MGTNVPIIGTGVTVQSFTEQTYTKHRQLRLGADTAYPLDGRGRYPAYTRNSHPEGWLLAAVAR